MKYISIGIIMLISFIISVVITKVEIPVLKRPGRISGKTDRSLIFLRREPRAWEGSRS